MQTTRVPSQDQKIHKSICVSTGSPHKLPVRVKKNLENCAVTRMMKENYCQTDYTVKKNCVSYCVPPSLNTYGTNANLPNEIQLRVHKFQTDNTLSVLKPGLDHGGLSPETPAFL